MKKEITFTIWVFSILTFICHAGFGQAKTNPFGLKEKHKQSSTAKTPEALNPGPLKASAAFNAVVSGDQHDNPKPVPFVFPGSINRQAFSAMSFAENGLLNFAESKEGTSIAYDERSEQAIASACYAFMDNIRGAMQIKDPSSEFIQMSLNEDELGWAHIKMQQYFGGVKVYGGQVILHGINGAITKFNGTYYPTPILDNLNPAINTQQAAQSAIEDVKTVTTFKELTDAEMEILDYTAPEVELIIYHSGRNLHSEQLAYHVTVRPNFLGRYEYFVNALTGEVIDYYNNTCTDGPHTAQAVDLNGITRTINTYQVGSKYYMIDGSKPMFNPGQSQLPDNPVGGIITLDANNSTGNDLSLFHVTSTNNNWNNPAAVSAQYNSDLTYQYYKNTHNRTSINGQGGTIISIINIADENGAGMDNAYWNGQAMFYGNGNQLFLPLAGALDVGAHEMTHGVVQNTANLEYKNESGAINEAMADISGAMVDRDDWQLGEDIIPNNSPYFPNGALRDMQNPHNGGSSFSDPSYQPMHTSEKYTGTSDNGGVHSNSGIINHAYYLLSESISKNKAEKLFYRALSQYMTKSSKFIDCRLAFEQSAKDLYGNNSAEYNAVVNAFYSVGIGEQGGGGGGSNTPGDLPVNPGQDFIVSIDVNSDDPNTIYISNTQGQDFIPISQTKVKRKLSITDNGEVAFFVDEDDNMKGIEMTAPYDEWFVSNEDVWDNVALSKDGKRLAAITTEIDSAIWVYSFEKELWAKYHLYNPTFTEGVVTQNVLYADAIEWDYTGQYLIYDAYNELENSDGDDIDYWDMGFIRVWNNAYNDWGDGNIFKLFSSLPEGVNVGNPSLSKNSPFIMAFDYFDDNTGDVAVLAANLETGDVATVFENIVLGFPNYSKNDNKIVFDAISEEIEVVGQIDMQADKITPTGDATLLINYAKFPVWYATGERNLIDVPETTQSDYFTNVYPNPFKDEINVVLDINKNTTYCLAVYNMYGKLLKEVHGETSGILVKETITLSAISEGTYLLRLVVDDQVMSKKIVRINQ